MVRKDLNMRKGKMIAQGAHASMAFLTTALRKCTVVWDELNLTMEEQEWVLGPFTKIVCYVNSEAELEEVAKKAEAAGLTVHRIVDNGLTEFKEPTYTCVGIGPHDESKFVGITDSLPLL